MLDKILKSSQDPEKISLTVRGILLKLVSVVIMIAPIFGYSSLDASSLTHIVENISVIIGSVLSLIALVMTTWGLIRKLWKPGELPKLSVNK